MGKKTEKSEKEKRLEEYKETLKMASELSAELEKSYNPSTAIYVLFGFLLMDRRFDSLTTTLNSMNDKLSWILGVGAVMIAFGVAVILKLFAL